MLILSWNKTVSSWSRPCIRISSQVVCWRRLIYRGRATLVVGDIYETRGLLCAELYTCSHHPIVTHRIRRGISPCTHTASRPYR